MLQKLARHWATDYDKRTCEATMSISSSTITDGGSAWLTGEPEYDDLERRLAEAPVIAVPTITVEGDANGAPHPDPAAYAKKFSGTYAHRLVEGGVGHNLPQEAPQAFAQAVLEVGGRA